MVIMSADSDVNPPPDPHPQSSPQKGPPSRPPRPGEKDDEHEDRQMKVGMRMIGSAMVFIGFLQDGCRNHGLSNDSLFHGNGAVGIFLCGEYHRSVYDHRLVDYLRPGLFSHWRGLVLA